MNIKIVFCILFVFTCRTALCQTTDSVVIDISKDNEFQKGLTTYNVTIRNYKQTPICILHSIFINLLTDLPPQGLAFFYKEGAADIYSLAYCMRDTLGTYELINNFNGEVILPVQRIMFKIFLQSTGNP